ncbi:hypothetical protein EYF80_062367 [Liparis tanakae]|uniref:Uncharacterized protein n=1 Tax=Liparis tanakae TaxID=230148 RepID=A0A4Z2EF32_9TELE|nr:hypothetical protein EYF80_062367 [Liparis tanakae]
MYKQVNKSIITEVKDHIPDQNRARPGPSQTGTEPDRDRARPGPSQTTWPKAAAEASALRGDSPLSLGLKRAALQPGPDQHEERGPPDSPDVSPACSPRRAAAAARPGAPDLPSAPRPGPRSPPGRAPRGVLRLPEPATGAKDARGAPGLARGSRGARPVMSSRAAALLLRLRGLNQRAARGTNDDTGRTGPGSGYSPSFGRRHSGINVIFYRWRRSQ